MSKKGNNTQKYKKIPWGDLCFESVKEQKGTAARCLFCNKMFKNRCLERLENHRKICEKKIERCSEDTDNSQLNETVPSSADLLQSESMQQDSISKTNLKASTLSFKSKSQYDASEIDETLAVFFFGCNIPFAVVESDNFLNFVKKLNLDYIPPSRRKLSGPLLDKVNENITNIKACKAETNSVLLIDGWKNKSKNEKYVVGTIHNASGDRFFLNAWDFTEKSETGDALKEVTEMAIIEAKQIYGTNIYAVVSDNVSTMINMGKKVDIWHTTCHSHSGNLLAKALVDDDFSSKVNKVLVEFKSPMLERQLVLLGGQKIVLPGETRWCSYRDANKSCLKNLSKMQEIVSKKICTVSSQVVKLIFDKNFENELLSSIIIYDGVCSLINKCQRNDFSIADALEEWLKLQLPLEDDILQSILEKRLKKVITPICLAANRLHPAYKGRLFSRNEEYLQMTSDFLQNNLNASGMEDLKAYDKESGIFDALNKKKIENPQTYWNLVQPHHPTLAELAKLLMNIPSSTAAIERLFSQWSYVHSKLRNRLSVEKSKKLINIYYFLKMKDNNITDEY